MDSILQSVKDIPPLPAIIPRVMSVLNDPNSSVSDLSEVLGSDQAIASKLLRLSNSAFYGFPKHIGTIQDAVVLLGFKTIKGLIYALSLYNNFDKHVAGYEMHKGELWRHSLAVAFLSRDISTRTKTGNPEQAFVAGLLHDIGKTILGEYVEQNVEEIKRLVEKENYTFPEAEEKVLGFSHTELGARVCEKWNLPDELLSAVRHHHNPAEGKDGGPLVPVVHIADAVCLMMGIGLGLDGFSYHVDVQALAALGKDWSFIDDILRGAQAKLLDINKFLPE
jgi:putative nucleotidyltransferase with HDIG domain